MSDNQVVALMVVEMMKGSEPHGNETYDEWLDNLIKRAWSILLKTRDRSIRS